MSAPKAPKPPVDRTLDALVRNTEAVSHLNATLTAFQHEYTQGRQTARETTLSITSKLDNLDRTISEVRLQAESSEGARQAELKRIFELLGEERKDRREITGTAGKDERELLRDIVRQELDGRRQERHLIVTAFQSIWKVGGKYIVLAVAVLVVAAVMKMTGLSLADLIGLARK